MKIYKRRIFDDILKDTLEDVSNVYGYKMMKTANIEESELFGCNFEGDISGKLFSIEGRFTNSVSLNYDSSISVLRSVVENKLYVDKSLPLKLMYLMEEAKYDRKNPNDVCKYVYGFECIGDKSVYLDVENILLCMKIIDFLGLGGYNLRINNLGEDEGYYLSFKQTLTNLGVDFEEDSTTQITIDLPEGVRPNRYEAEFTFYNSECGNIDTILTFDVLYPNSIIVSLYIGLTITERTLLVESHPWSLVILTQ